jgi:hypothetical protein
LRQPLKELLLVAQLDLFIEKKRIMLTRTNKFVQIEPVVSILTIPPEQRLQEHLTWCGLSTRMPPRRRSTKWRVLSFWML